MVLGGSASTGLCYTPCYKNSTTAAVPSVCRGCTVKQTRRVQLAMVRGGCASAGVCYTRDHKSSTLATVLFVRCAVGPATRSPTSKRYCRTAERSAFPSDCSWALAL